MSARQPTIAVLPELSGARVLIVGLGATGLSCVRYLHGIGCRVAVTDSREHPPEAAALRDELPDVATMLGGFDERAFAAADQIVLSPGVALSQLESQLNQREVPVCGDIELFAQAATAPVIAITGSNGKSTVTALLGQMARRAGMRVGVGGNLGPPALDLLSPDAELYVLELSSFQLETTATLRADAVALLNLSADHLDRYPGFSAYAAAKQRIFQNARAAVINRDDPLSRNLPAMPTEVVSFGLTEPKRDQDWGLTPVSDSASAEFWLSRGHTPLVPISEVRMVGEHNLANALAALALGDLHGLPLDPLCESLAEFSGLPHRCELVAERAGVRWIDDSKGTNPGATVAALRGVAAEQAGRGKIVLIAGGDGKEADFSPLTSALGRFARAVILIGRDAPLVRAIVPDGVPCFDASDMNSAVVQAADQAHSGDAVLLSPACASFDMFRDYQHRGRVFSEAVLRLVA